MRITKTSKVLSLILTICILFGMIVTTNAEEITTEVISETVLDAEAIDVEAIDAETEPEVEVIKFDETYEFKFIERFDLMSCYNYDDFEVDKPVSRAEYAKILCNWGGFDPVTGGNKFVDIHDNEYEKHINAVTLRKLMEGYDKYTFLPDQGITLMEAVKPILILAGYENFANQQGGYPNGYLQVAGDLDMLDGLNLTASDIVSRGDLARIVYNSRNIEIYNAIDFVDVDGELKTPTLMTECMNIDCVRGLVKDNGITGLRSDEKSRIGYITIGNKQFKLRNQLEVRTYVGRYVEAYYTSKPDENGEKTLEYIHLDKVYSKDEISFDITKFRGLSGRTVKFENEKEKEQKIELTTSVNYIYNNKAVKSINESMFDFDYGTVTYVPARKGTADTIIIEGFVSWFIVASDKNLNYITTSNECEPIEGNRRLDLPAADIGSKIFIEDYYGWDGDIFDISPYDVVEICKSVDYVYIKAVDPDIQEKKVKGNTKVDYKPAIKFSDDDVYVASPYYATTEEFKNISVGALYYVYRNSAGHIVKLLNITNVDMKTAYLIRSYYDVGEEIGYIKILTTDKKYETLTVDKKITFSDSKNVTTPSMKSVVALCGPLLNYNGIINYSVNKLGLVKKIYLPVDKGVEREVGRLGCIYQNDVDGNPSYWEQGTHNTWGGMFLHEKNIGTFVLYTDKNEIEDRYKYITLNSIAAKYDVPTKAYNYDPESLYADLMYQEYVSELTPTKNAAIITDMSEETIYAGESYVKLETVLIPAGTVKTYYAKREDLEKAMDVSLTAPELYWKVEKGDIIVFDVDAADASVIDTMALLWDANAENPTDKENGRRGNVPGNIGYRDANKGAISNPFVWYKTNSISTAYNYVYTSQNMAMVGYPYHVDSRGGMIFTTQELSTKDYDPKYDPDKYAYKVFQTSANMISVTYSNNQVHVKTGETTDIRTYKADGHNASRVLLKLNYGRPNFMVVFNGEMK